MAAEPLRATSLTAPNSTLATTVYATIDEVKIQDLEPPVAENAFDIGPNMVIVIIAVSLIFAVAWLLRRAIQLWIIRPKI